MAHERLTPLSELNRKNERVTQNLLLPNWVNADEIGFDLPRIIQLMNLGGVRHLQLGSKNSKDSHPQISIVGVTPAGEAVGGFAEAKQTPIYSLEYLANKAQFDFIRNLEWFDLKVDISVDQISRNISDNDKSIRNPKSWIPFLDTSLRESLRKSATSHLVDIRRFNTAQQIGFLWFNGNLISGVLDSLRNEVPIPAILLGRLVGSTMNNIFLNWFGSKVGANYRYSLLPSFEIDRALILQLLSRTKPVVRNIGDNI